ncbi:tRNA pseudouridine(55) synthase TruB [Candidatus Haliotispira prima]|uniref:tRNA pseudouridine synthase B n=1 Tax=Candidatus Haliotispira prima TaxID=3034016 RepID=A0ABY8MI20_9SPIO|nr:tRNA pseudouridine(55) synthase TruB [Candidatus Haliotispira prima]
MKGHVYYLYKEKGDTSFQSIRKLQKTYGLKKVGHCGTLDKFAEGLLIVLSGNATKLAGAITGLDKSYIAEIEFGKETDTLDPDGRVIEEAVLPTEAVIRSALSAWLAEIEGREGPAGNSHGELWQRPPAFSAIHVGGERSYKRALAGEDMSALPERKVALYSCEILRWEAPILQVKLHCSKGFYVRSFARDLARRCASVGHLRSLLRTSVGSLGLDRAGKLGEGVPVGDFIDLLSQLEGRLPLDVWRTGRDVYCEREMPKEIDGETHGEIGLKDWTLLRQGRIPGDIFRAACERYGRSPSEEGRGMQGEVKEFALLHQRQIIALFRFRWEAEGEAETSGLEDGDAEDKLRPVLKFWHNFSNDCES